MTVANNDVAIIGVGLHPFGRFDKSAMQMGAEAIHLALADAGAQWSDIQFGVGGSYEISNPDAVTRLVGLTGIPFTNVFNACATAASAAKACADGIRLGDYDIGIAVGLDKHPKGAFTEDPALGGIDRAGLRSGRIDRLEDPQHIGLLPIERSPLPGQLCSWPGQIGHRNRPVTIQREGQTRRGAGHPAGSRSRIEDLAGRLVEMDRHRKQRFGQLMATLTGGRDEEVDHRRLVSRPSDDHEPARSQPGQCALDRKGSESGRDRRVDLADRVAATRRSAA